MIQSGGSAEPCEGPAKPNPPICLLQGPLAALPSGSKTISRFNAASSYGGITASGGIPLATQDGKEARDEYQSDPTKALTVAHHIA